MDLTEEDQVTVPNRTRTFTLPFGRIFPIRFYQLVILGVVSALALAEARAASDAEMTRPVGADGKTRIEALIYVAELTAIDTVLEKFDADVVVGLRWRDPRLAHPGPDPMIKPVTDVWHPGVAILNELDLKPVLEEVVLISPEGDVVLRQLYSGSFSQPLALRDFPFDTQRLSVRLAVTNYSAEQIEVVRSKEQEQGMTSRPAAPNWTVTGWRAAPRSHEVLPGFRTLAGYELTFDTRRGANFYILKVIVPLILILMMSWVVFWLEPTEAGAQIGVSTSAILTMVAFRFSIGSYTPDLSYFTKLDYFVFGSTLLVFSTLFEVLITSWLAEQGRIDQAKRVDRWSRWLFPAATILMGLETLGFRVFQ